MSQVPFVRRATPDNVFRSLGNEMFVLASGEDTNGAYTVIQIQERQGNEPPPHVHAREDEAFYVVDGEITYYVGDRVIEAAPGSYLFAPRGVEHTFKLKTPTARVVVTAYPAGFETFIREVGRALPDSLRPDPASPPHPDDIRKLTEIAGRYGIEIMTG